ncbi:hypothetical protein PCCS19_31700 [Paenibacillus sp. CCS19]|uniref:hypothetical protein n=1 Tax=Paenibacillus sp. CCS19 TaxID=3158387 RepID=UPI002563DB68|nr:hypothetical protein [Paenibacillus cellulosilyticus]GMK40115.1 hypothetical protein PCCS19_31700 [Paenibacillus cellulosilyticus]
MVSRQHYAGIALLGAGLVILLGKSGFFSFIGSVLWPVILLVAGILLHVLYFGRMLPTVALVPAGTLSVYGLLFLICSVFGWSSFDHLWPFVLFGPAAGLYEYYAFEPFKPRLALQLAVGLGAVTVIAFGFILISSWSIYVIGLVLIAAGLWLTVGRGRKSRW